MRRAAPWLLLASSWPLGCSLWLGDDVAPAPAVTEPEPMPEPMTEPGPWDCLGKLDAIKPDATREVTLDLHVTDLKSAPLENVAVTFCRTLDPACTPQTDDIFTDAEGDVSLQVPHGLHGALIVKGPGEILPTLVYLEPPPVASSKILIPLLDQVGVALTSSLANRKVVPETGIVLVSTADCDLKYNPLTPGVHFDLAAPGPETVGFYLVNQLPDPTPTQTGPNGVGGFVNVPPGLASITASLPDEGDLEVGHSNFLVRAGWLTYAAISPYNR